MADTLTFAVPVEWSKTTAYEQNIIVFVGKRAYTSLKAVPSGVEITDTSYWAETGVPQGSDTTQLKADIETLKGNVSTLQSDLSTTNSNITDLQNATVGTEKLDDNAVTTAKLDDNAVTTAKLDDNAVTTAKIKNASITNSKIAKGTLLIFSDSWGDFEAGYENWATNIAAFLNCEYKNYSIGGGGFINRANGKNFFDMYNKAVNEVPSNEANYVIIIGGNNDVNNGNTIDSTNRQAVAFCNNVTTAWPNAKVYAMVGQPIAPYDLGISSTAKYMNNKHITVEFLQSIVWNNGKVVPITGQYSMGGMHLPAELLRADGCHLNAAGRKAMESLLRNCICGNSFNQLVNQYKLFHFENDSVVIHLYLTIVNGMLTTGGLSTVSYIKLKSDATSVDFTLKISDYPILATMLAMPQLQTVWENAENRSDVFGLCFSAARQDGWYYFDFHNDVATNSCHIYVSAEAAGGTKYYFQPFSYPVM